MDYRHVAAVDIHSLSLSGRLWLDILRPGTLGDTWSENEPLSSRGRFESIFSEPVRIGSLMGLGDRTSGIGTLPGPVFSIGVSGVCFGVPCLVPPTGIWGGMVLRDGRGACSLASEPRAMCANCTLSI